MVLSELVLTSQVYITYLHRAYMGLATKLAIRLNVVIKLEPVSTTILIIFDMVSTGINSST